MVNLRVPSPPSLRAKGVRRVTPVLMVLAVALGGVPAQARAALVAEGDGNRVGNGKLNRNNVSVNTVKFIRGIQQITTHNIGGITGAQASFCKRKTRHCHIVQRISVP